MTGSDPANRSLSTRVLAVLTLGSLLLASALGAAYLLLHDGDSSEGYASKDLSGQDVLWDQPPDLEGSAVRETGARFRAPRQDLSVPLMSAVINNNEINPPTLTAAYWYRDVGALDGPGAAVVAMHAVRGGRGPGNAFVELGSQRDTSDVLISRGDPLHAGGWSYRVTRTMVTSKQATAADARIWGERGAHRLVVITCLLEPGVALEEQKNLVVFARPQNP